MASWLFVSCFFWYDDTSFCHADVCHMFVSTARAGAHGRKVCPVFARVQNARFGSADGGDCTGVEGNTMGMVQQRGIFADVCQMFV